VKRAGTGLIALRRLFEIDCVYGLGIRDYVLIKKLRGTFFQFASYPGGGHTRQEDVEVSHTQGRISPSIQRMLRKLGASRPDFRA